MSSSFTIDVATPPLYEDVFAAIASPELRCEEGRLEDYQGAWQTGVLHLYHHGRSTRSVEVAYDGARAMTVRILALSSPTEYQLAFRVVEHLGTAGRITHEEIGELPADQVRTSCSGDWMARDLAISVQAMATAVRTAGGGFVRVPGPVRSAYLSVRTLDELGDDGQSDLDPLAVLERLRAIQHLGDDVVTASVIDLPGVDIRLSVWTPEETTLFFDVTHIGLKSPDGNFYIPVAALPEVVGANLRRLDDRQFVIDAISTDELDALLARAAARTENIWADAEPRRRWWQFWRS